MTQLSPFVQNVCKAIETTYNVPGLIKHYAEKLIQNLTEFQLEGDDFGMAFYMWIHLPSIQPQTNQLLRGNLQMVANYFMASMYMAVLFNQKDKSVFLKGCTQFLLDGPKQLGEIQKQTLIFAWKYSHLLFEFYDPCLEIPRHLESVFDLNV